MLGEEYTLEYLPLFDEKLAERLAIRPIMGNLFSPRVKAK